MTTMERDLKVLRRSRLMMYSEFRTMMTALEKYHKDVTVGVITGKKISKDLDLRPFLYDEGDSYEKPFYGTLLKMLYEVAKSNYVDKQSEDLQKIFNWYRANKTLITSPPKIKIPTVSSGSPSPNSSPSPSPLEEDTSSGSDEGFEEEELGEIQKVPKLHMRPKTAPAVENRKGVRYVTWNEAQANGTYRRRTKCSHKYSSQENLTRSLTINPYGTYRTVSGSVSGGRRIQRPGTAPPYTSTGQARNVKGLKPSFVLKPFKSTPVPNSSPASSLFSSPRASPENFSRSKSPISARFSPDIPKKDAAVYESGKKIKRTERQETKGYPDTWISNTEDDFSTNITVADEACDERILPSGISVRDLKQIVDQQNKEEELLKQQQDLLEKNLFHFQDCFVGGKETVKRDSGSHKPLHMAPVRTYDVGPSKVIQSYSRIYSEVNQPNQFSGADVLEVDAILGMVTPIGLQMKCDKERQDKERINSQREFLNLVSSRQATRTPSPVIEASLNVPSNSSNIVRPASPKPEVLAQVLSQRTTLEPEMRGPSLDIKAKEPDLNPEKGARDYTVHFPQPEKIQDGASKSFKVSGPVAPDTVRYQWTDDGFGGKTYMKRLKTPTSPRTSRKRHPASPVQLSRTRGSDHVTLPVGNRSLDKKTLASLMLVQRLNEKKSGGTLTVPTVAQPSNDTENMSYSYQLQYMSFCQPLGPRLSECDKPSSVNWYLQGDHGLYRDPVIRSVTDSDLLRSKRTELRIPKERSLVIEGKHIGGESAETETRKNLLSSCSTSTIESDKSSEDSPVGLMITAKRSLTSPRTPSISPRASPRTSPCSSPRVSRPISPRVSRPVSPRVSRPISPRVSRPVSPRVSQSLPRKPITVPTVTCSRPTSARGEQSEPTFNVKQFRHFCWPDDPDLKDDYKRQLEAWAAVNIQRIFRGHMARQYARQLKFAQEERERKAAIQLQSTFRGFLTRKRLIERKMMSYAPSTRDEEWARQYEEDLKKRETARKQKKQLLLMRQNREFEKHSEQVKQVQATQNIYDAFHPTPEGPTKAQKRAAAIVIQKYFRGWFVRRMFKKSKSKALKRTLSFGKFTRNYQALIYKIQKRYGIENPTTVLQFNQLMEYVERLNKYEVIFEKFAVDGVIKYKDIKDYFKACGHFPSQKEIDDAITIVTKATAKGRDLTKAEAVEVLFQIYVPKGTGLKLSDVRKSTWMNPLVDGRDAMHLLSKKDLKETNLLKCFDLIAGAEAESEAVKDLLRPMSAKKNVASSNRKGAKNSTCKENKGRKASKGDIMLAQYPHNRPSSSCSNRSTRSKK